MDMYPKYKSPLGYSTGDNNIDAYGVDHSGFSTRDELEYQFARQNKENQLIQNYNNQGITKNYPQQGTNFWGSSPENNYGFGTSKIHNNIENMQNQTNWGNSNNTQWGMNDTSLGLQNNELENNQKLQAVDKNISPRETLWYENLANEASKFGKIFAKEIKSDLADVGYGAKKALNGLTLGGSDWVMRRLGMDNEYEYLAQKDAEGTGVAARIGGTVSEIGGNMLGAGTGIVKGLGKLGLTGTKLAGVSGLVEGGITGAANSDTWSELPQKMLTGSALGLIGGVAGQKVLDMVIKPFSSKAATYGMNGGMENVIANPEATSLVVRGIKQNDDLAKQALGQIPPVSKNLNNQTADILQQSLGHKINLPQTIAAQKPKTEQYVLQHADDEVLDFAPTREQLISYPAESKFNPNDYKKSKAEVVIRDRANMQGLNIYNDGLVGEKSGVNHFLGTDRRPFIRTLNNTLNYPDIKFTWEGKQHYSKKYTNNNSSHNFMDLVITKNGKIFNKFPTNENFIKNKISGAQDLSFKAPLSNTFKPINGVSDNGNNISYIDAVVNPSLPNVSEVYKGLSGDAAAGMKQAISQGLDKTTQKAGSLDSVYRIKKELDNIVLAAKNSRSADYKALEQAQNNYSKFYAKAMQGRDKGFNLEQAYNAGLNNQTTVLPMITPLEKNAFSQGLFTKIGQNNGLNQNMASLALDYRSSLANALRPKSFNRLEHGLEQNAAQFNRLSAIGNAAESRLKFPQNQRLWEQGNVQSYPKNSSLGLSLGILKDKLQGNMLKRSTQNLLNPDFVGSQNNLLLEEYPKVGGFASTQFYFEDK